MKSFWRSPFLTLILVAVDAIALARLWSGAWELRAWLDRFDLFPQPINPSEAYLRALPLLVFFWLCVLAHFRFYSHHERISDLNRLGPVFWASLWVMIVPIVYNTTHKPVDFGRSVVGFFGAATGCYLFASRTLFRLLKRRAIRRGHGLVRALVVGAGELGHETVLRAREHPDIGFQIVGFVSAVNDKAAGEIEGYPVLGTTKDLVAIVQRHRVEEVFLAVPEMKEDDLFDLIETLQAKAQVTCKVVADMLYVIVNRAKVDEIIGLPVIAFRGSELYPAQLMLKRVMDLLVGGVLAALLALPALVFALIIRLDSRGPALFAHERVGLGGRRFRLIKFRTMHCDAHPYSEAPCDQSDGRITRFGRFLRRTSLDEIPQLLNVLRGEMSLVGPRPEMPFIVERYKRWQAARLRVKPGLTGLWQVAGRKNLPLHHNLEYDYYYVKNQSLALDAEILLLTVPAVFLGRGAY